MRLLFGSLAITARRGCISGRGVAIKDGRKTREGLEKRGVHNGIMFARWPFYPLTMIPPVSSKLRGGGFDETRGAERNIYIYIYPIHFAFR